MKPYNKEFLLEKIKEYNEIIDEAKIEDCEIIKTKNEKLMGYCYEKETPLDIETVKLMNNDELVMEISAREIEGCYCAIKKANGKVGIVGLGLGYSAIEMAKKKNVKSVTVYEKNPEVIELFKKNFGNNRKIKIIYGDAFKAKKNNFDYFFVDIYSYELTEKVVEDYKKFHEIHKISEYTFFGVEYFLLNCRYDEVVWVYVPELWMEMSKRIFAALQECGYIDQKIYKELNSEVISELLGKFKVVLNEDEN